MGRLGSKGRDSVCQWVKGGHDVGLCVQVGQSDLIGAGNLTVADLPDDRFDEDLFSS